MKRDLGVTWDPAKAAANRRKHGVSFEEGRDAMADVLSVSSYDAAHSHYEDRWILIGETRSGILLTVSFTIRDDLAHIISVRRPTPAEKRRYMTEKEIIRDAPLDDEMLPDYGHLEGWQRGRFHFPKLVGTVTLDTDVYDVFRTSEQVNDALRMLIREGRVPHLQTR